MPKEWEKKEYLTGLLIIMLMGGFFISLLSLSIWQNVINRDDRVSEAREKINKLDCSELEDYFQRVHGAIYFAYKNRESDYAKDLWIEKCTFGLKDND